MDFIHKRIANLISVKSIVTILLTGVFGYLSIIGNITGEQFLSIFTVIIAFYFGTQTQKISDAHWRGGLFSYLGTAAVPGRRRTVVITGSGRAAACAG